MKYEEIRMKYFPGMKSKEFQTLMSELDYIKDILKESKNDSRRKENLNKEFRFLGKR